MANIKERFEYRFFTKHLNAVFVMLYLSLVLPITIGIIIQGKAEVAFWGIVALWAIFIPLIILSLLAENRSRILYLPVEIEAKGIKAQIRSSKHKYFPKLNIKFLPWSSFNSFELFSFPDQDSVEGSGKRGMRLWIGEKKIVIYESINNYNSLLKIIENQLPRQ